MISLTKIASSSRPASGHESSLAALADQLAPLITPVHLKTADVFAWSPKRQEILYPANQDDLSSQAALLHEAGHARLGHANYQTDLELLLMEVDAWQEALKLADKLGVVVRHEHIENCLDTYRDWLHRRSTCPLCGNRSLETRPTIYECFNCSSQWHVSRSRFCRPYRRLLKGAC